jgi:hypothetical protein
MVRYGAYARPVRRRSRSRGPYLIDSEFTHALDPDGKGWPAGIAHVWTALRWQGCFELLHFVVGAAMCPAFDAAVKRRWP